MKIPKLLPAMIPLLILAGCASGNCRKNQAEASTVTAPEGTPPTATSATTAKDAKSPSKESTMAKPNDRVRVFKYDGSLQCNQGKAVPLETMKKELKDIRVFGAENKADSLMRIQQCGTPTGRANVYEIAREDLDAAKKLGFQLWTFD